MTRRNIVLTLLTLKLGMSSPVFAYELLVAVPTALSLHVSDSAEPAIMLAQARRWSAGERLASGYRSAVVNDWRQRNLRRQAGGQQWVRTSDQYVLITVSSGNIIQVVNIN